MAADFAKRILAFPEVEWREIGANEGCPRIPPNFAPESRTSPKFPLFGLAGANLVQLRLQLLQGLLV